MISAMFRRIFYADAAAGPSLPSTDNRQEPRMFPDRDVLFARRGQRVNNRKPEAARAYERVHLILARGPKC